MRLTASERRRRVIGASIWAVLFVIGWLTIGIPTDPVEAFVWIWARRRSPGTTTGRGGRTSCSCATGRPSSCCSSSTTSRAAGPTTVTPHVDRDDPRRQATCGAGSPAARCRRSGCRITSTTQPTSTGTTCWPASSTSRTSWSALIVAAVLWMRNRDALGVVRPPLVHADRAGPGDLLHLSGRAAVAGAAQHGFLIRPVAPAVRPAAGTRSACTTPAACSTPPRCRRRTRSPRCRRCTARTRCSWSRSSCRGCASAGGRCCSRTRWR